MKISKKLKVFLLPIFIQFSSVSYADTTETDTLVFPGWLSAKLNYTVDYKGPYKGTIKQDLSVSKSQGICFFSLDKHGNDNVKAEVYLNSNDQWFVDVATPNTSSVAIRCLKWV